MVAVAAAVAAAVVAVAEDEDEDEACARCSRHGPPPLDRSSMISSSPSSAMHHPPAEIGTNMRVSYIEHSIDISSYNNEK